MAGDKLRLLLVTARYLPHIGGTEVHTYEVARRLAAAGHDVTVLTTMSGEQSPSAERTDRVQVLRVPAWPANRDYYFSPGIYRAITRGTWDVIHCQGYHTLVPLVAMLAAWRSKTPYVVTFHSGGHSSRVRNALRGLQRALLRPLLARADLLIGVSQFEADLFQRALQLPKERFIVIPNGCYLPTPSPPTVMLNEGPLIVSIGRLERYKGHHRVIEALPRLEQVYPGLRLRVVGTGPYEATLRKMAHALGVADRVEFQTIPVADRHGMASVLLRAALVILLSDYESQGISVLEALALGRPVLVADTSVLRDLAQEGLVRATPLGSTPEQLAQAVETQLRQPLVPPIVNLPSWDACAEQLLGVYRSVVQAARAHPHGNTRVLPPVPGI